MPSEPKTAQASLPTSCDCQGNLHAKALSSGEGGGGGLGRRMVSGMAWSVVQMVGNKALNMASMVVLAWLLAKEDFGLIALSITITNVVTVLSNPGIDTLLLQRSRRLRCWATPIFWMAILISLAGSLLLVGVGAPLAVYLYQDDRFWRLLPIMAVSSFIGTFGMVPNVILTAQMRFRQQTIISTASTLVTCGLSIFLAWRGWGVYSFVWPPLAATSLGVILQWAWTRPPIRMRPEFRRWRYLLGDSGTLFTQKVLATSVAQSDRVVLGQFCSKEIVGVYFFGYSYALQAIVFLNGVFSRIFVPALNTMALEPKRQLDSAIRAARLIGFVGMPLCLLQAVTAAPLMRLIYGQKWDMAVTVVQWVSFGIVFDCVAWMATWMMQVRGDFGKQLRYYIVTSLFWVGFVLLGVWWTNDHRGPAMAITAYHLLVGPVWTWRVWKKYGATGRDFLSLYFPSLPLAMTAMLSTWAMFQWIDISHRPQQLMQTLLLLSVGGLLYVLLARWFAQAMLAECLGRIKPLAGRLLPWPGFWNWLECWVRGAH